MASPALENDPAPARSHPLMARLAGIPGGRRTKWVVLVLWIIVMAAVAPFAGQLGDVEENDSAAWLPGNAESFEVAQLQEQFPQGETAPAVIVYQRESGLSDADLATIEADRAALAERFPATAPPAAMLSEDGLAALVIVPLPAGEGGFSDQLFEDVDDIRALVASDDGELEVAVTGPAGYAADLIDVFEGIDTTLLLATAAVVAVILLITYRSPFLWLVPLVVVAFANQAATAAVYALAKHYGLAVNGQSSGILPVLVFGAGTDYALLLISRYREELRRHEDKHLAMAAALRSAGPAILASGGTVVAGLLCLTVADLNPTAGLGPVGALGVVSALVAMLTLLPAVLVIFGRRLFWPFVPRYGSESHEASNIWSRVGSHIARRPRPIWIGTSLLLVVMAIGLTGLDSGQSQADTFRTEPESITGQKLLAASFPGGASQPAAVIANTAAVSAVQEAIENTPGVAGVSIDGEFNDLTSFAVTLTGEPGSQAAFDQIEGLRAGVHAVPDAHARVGGSDAIALDIANASARDEKVIIPLVLAVVLIILGLLLRSVVASLVLTATVVLSFAAALGASIVIFNNVFGFEGIDPALPLLAFVFLVALGIDYNIFLMSRVHEEAARIGTRAGMLKGLAVTGGVITSAGIVLAATFSVLAVLPLVFLTQLGFIVAFGVLLDTLIVRSVLVPAITLDLDRRIWWPSRLARASAAAPERTATELGQAVAE